MVKSMTGYGKCVDTVFNKKITVEIKSLNSKQLDINARMAPLYKEKEIELRNMLAKNVERGKCDLMIYYDATDVDQPHQINRSVVRGYFDALKSIVSELEATDENLLAMVMRLPDVTKAERPELDPEEWAAVQGLVKEALKNLNGFREQEGKILENDFRGRIAKILELLAAVDPFEAERVEAVKLKIDKSLKESMTEEHIDRNRFEQELIYYLEKLDVTEEKVRLKNHCEYFLQTLEQPQSLGKKLGFICQEIGREINTLGSKSNHAPLQRIVVQMKDELEKIKEQVLNVL